MDTSTFYTIAYSRIYKAMNKAWGIEQECKVNNCRNTAKEYADRAAGMGEALAILRELNKEVCEQHLDELIKEKEMLFNA
jgi:hypothetical protein